jgi:hypothetical protein
MESQMWPEKKCMVLAGERKESFMSQSAKFRQFRRIIDKLNFVMKFWPHSGTRQLSNLGPAERELWA